MVIIATPRGRGSDPRRGSSSRCRRGKPPTRRFNAAGGVLPVRGPIVDRRLEVDPIPRFEKAPRLKWSTAHAASDGIKYVCRYKYVSGP